MAEEPLTLAERRAFLKLPMEERRRILAEQADRLAGEYERPAHQHYPDCWRYEPACAAARVDDFERIAGEVVSCLTQDQRSFLIQRLRNALTFGDDPLVRLLKRYPPAGAAPSPTPAVPPLGRPGSPGGTG